MREGDISARFYPQILSSLTIGCVFYARSKKKEEDALLSHLSVSGQSVLRSVSADSLLIIEYIFCARLLPRN